VNRSSKARPGDAKKRHDPWLPSRSDPPQRRPFPAGRGNI
jgi:hypothetical protein